MSKYKLLLFIVTTCCLLNLESFPATIQMGTFDNISIFFYDLSEKKEISQEIIQDVSFRMMHGILPTTPQASHPIVRPLATLYPDPVSYTEEEIPFFLDPLGKKILTFRTNQMKDVLRRGLDIGIIADSPMIDLVLNFDEAKFYKKEFLEQLDFLHSNNIDLEKFFFVEETTLIDWEMAKGTFASTIIQDIQLNDRFIFPHFPNSIKSSLFVEKVIPMIDTNNQSKNIRTKILRCDLPPIDHLSTVTSGSAKGKCIAFKVNGLVPKEEIAKLQLRSSSIPFNIGQRKCNEIFYPNEILIKCIPDALQIDKKSVVVLPEEDGVEIFESNGTLNSESIAQILEIFSIKCPLEEVQVKHIIKKSSGFTGLDIKSLEIPDSSFVVLLNNSEIPKGYCYYNLAQTFMHEGFQWVQLYHLSPNQAMCLSGEQLKQLCLTPAEEIFYRNAELDAAKKNTDLFLRKITSTIDLLIFPHR